MAGIFLLDDAFIGDEYVALLDCLSFQNLADLAETNQCASRCVRSYAMGFPTFIKQHFWPPRSGYILLFGLHHAHPMMRLGESFGRFHERIHPSPIAKLDLSGLGWNATGFVASGNFLSELDVTDLPPSGLGRLQPNVCMLDNGDVFYCGGSHGTCSRVPGVISGSDCSDCLSVVAATFNVHTRVWNRLPDMPEGRIAASTCQVDNRVILIGGEGPGPKWGSSYAQTVLCFDLLKHEWVHCTDDPLTLYFPQKPGPGYSNSAIGVVDNRHVIVAGGCDKGSDYCGETVENCNEAWILDTGYWEDPWTQLPPMPKTHESSSSHSGLVLADGRFAVLSKHNFLAYNFARHEWDQLPPPPTDIDGQVVAVGTLLMAVDSDQSVGLYFPDESCWRTVPLPKPPRQFGISLGVRINNHQLFLQGCTALHIH